MILERPRIINEEFHASEISPEVLDVLLADGWRHFGRHFFRYNYGVYNNELRRVLPLRIQIADFELSKSQRKTIRQNQDLQTAIGKLAITSEIEDLFHRHKQRFRSGVPDSIYDFLPREGESPTDCRSVTVRKEGDLVAASFFDIGHDSLSSVYGIFEPELAVRRLGIFTMLREIEYAREAGKSLLYHGYAYEGESFYDYKKRFNALEVFDWNESWTQTAFI
jgi:arginyl-tRNA--protein-N-Asp/Glu arginylyltransferase